MLAGFRFDGFSAIKHRCNHSPSTDLDAEDGSCLIEERLIAPAVLCIQVCAVQESQKLVTIGMYRLPEVKPSTAMYFDFPRPISSQRITFRLAGDVAAFSDDPSEQDDQEYRAFPGAAGLSLANKIKLYYYADAYELGKWVSLSAI